MADLRFERTSRGFAIARFVDHYGSKCSLQKSSFYPDPEYCIWLGVDRAFTGEQAATRMHLTQSQVRALLPALQHFVEHGDLPVDDN